MLITKNKFFYVFTQIVILTLLVLTTSLHSVGTSNSLSLQASGVITRAVVVEISPPWDVIDSGVKECFLDALSKAESEGKALIYLVDSYGGYLNAAYVIGDAVSNSRIPTIAYVSGGKALSAGTMIILPASIIALHPSAIIGAMQPVIINPVTGELQFINESKIINPVVEKALNYARLRGRNETLVRDFVVRATTVNAEKAVSYGVADLIAQDLPTLLRIIHGGEITVSGKVVRLEIDKSGLEFYACSVRSRLLSLLENPTVLNVLLTIGLLGTIFALLSGRVTVLPLTLLFLLLGLIGSGLNPNLVSLFLIILGSTLLAIELFVLPGFGIVGISGIILLAFGFALLPTYLPSGLVPSEEYLNALRAFVVSTSVILGGFFGILMFKVIKARRKKPYEFLPTGKVGKAIDDLSPGKPGFVIVEGEYWKAVSDEEIAKGSEVVVVSVEGAILRVKKK
ncbi:MAG: NfeD family protein [Desulfurococcaceae archaeon TW002]